MRVHQDRYTFHHLIDVFRNYMIVHCGSFFVTAVIDGVAEASVHCLNNILNFCLVELCTSSILAFGCVWNGVHSFGRKSALEVNLRRKGRRRKKKILWFLDLAPVNHMLLGFPHMTINMLVSLDELTFEHRRWRIFSLIWSHSHCITFNQIWPGSDAFILLLYWSLSGLDACTFPQSIRFAKNSDRNQCSWPL